METQSAMPVWVNMFQDCLKQHPLPEMRLSSMTDGLITSCCGPLFAARTHRVRETRLDFRQGTILVSKLSYDHVCPTDSLVTLMQEAPIWALSELCAAMLGVIIYVVRRAEQLRNHAVLTAVTCLGLVAATLPSWFIVVILNSLVDPLFMTLLVLIMVAVLAAALVLHPVYRLILSRRRSHGRGSI